jgi:hypothetical protein
MLYHFISSEQLPRRRSVKKELSPVMPKNDTEMDPHFIDGEMIRELFG